MEAQHSLWPLSDNFLFYFQICRRRSLEAPSPADSRALLGLRSCNSEGCPTFRCAVEKARLMEIQVNLPPRRFRFLNR